MKIIVGGASGFIGKALIRVLSERNHTCRVVSRRPSGDGERAIAWDDSGLPEAIGSSDVVINLAGAPVLGGRWTDQRKHQIITSRVRTAERIAGIIGALEKKPKVWINASAVGYYGDRGDEILNESSVAGAGFLAEVSQAWETALFKDELDVRRISLRIGVVLGREGGAMKKLLLPFKLGLGGPIGTGRQWMPWIHMDDVLGLIDFVIQNEGISGPLNVTAPGPLTNREFSKTLARVLRRPAVLPTPAWGIRMIFGEAAEVILGSQRAVPDSALKSGYTFKFPVLEQAFEDLLR